MIKAFQYVILCCELVHGMHTDIAMKVHDTEKSFQWSSPFGHKEKLREYIALSR